MPSKIRIPQQPVVQNTQFLTNYFKSSGFVVIPIPQIIKANKWMNKFKKERKFPRIIWPVQILQMFPNSFLFKVPISKLKPRKLDFPFRRLPCHHLLVTKSMGLSERFCVWYVGGLKISRWFIWEVWWSTKIWYDSL